MSKVSQAQKNIGGMTVAVMIREFQSEFRDIYPPRTLAKAVGPEQAFIGMCIEKGFLKLGDLKEGK